MLIFGLLLTRANIDWSLSVRFWSNFWIQIAYHDDLKYLNKSFKTFLSL